MGAIIWQGNDGNKHRIELDVNDFSEGYEFTAPTGIKLYLEQEGQPQIEIKSVQKLAGELIIKISETQQIKAS